MRKILCAIAAICFASTPAQAAGKPLAISLTNATVTEGQSAALRVAKSGGNGSAVTISWSSSNGSSGKLSLVGSTPGTITVPTPDDNVINGTRTVTVTAIASGSTGAKATGNITVLDNDVAAVIPSTYSMGGWTARAGDDAYINVHRTSGNTVDTIRVTTADNTALAGVDYQAIDTTISLPIGQDLMTVNVPTKVNPAQAGKTLTFYANIYLNGKNVSGGGMGVIQPAAPVVVPQPPVATFTCPAGAVVAVGDPCPKVDLPTPSLTGLPDIASNFDVTQELLPAPSPPDRSAQIGTLSDPQGAFRFLCNAGPVLYDDPIVYPNQPGKSHLHQFYGNTEVNGSSTYESLRKTGDSTCFSKANRSAYWMPAMLDGKGNVVRPDYVAIYYKRFPKSDPRCNPSNIQFVGYCTNLPNGLRFISGFNMADPSKPINGFQWFNCDGATATPGIYKDIPTAAANCPVGNRLGAVIGMPDCWDGKNLDTVDHHSHMVPHGTGVVYTYADGTVTHDWDPYKPLAATNGVVGYEKCPADHPYILPTFTIGAWFAVAPGDEPLKWSLASDAMFPNLAPGTTLHNDWFGAWDPQVLVTWEDNCVDKYMSCDSGNLGNNTALKMTNFTWVANPHLVPVPPMPSTMKMP